MATMIVELYDALKATGAPEEGAGGGMALAYRNEWFDRADERFDRIDADLVSLKTDVAIVRPNSAW